MQIVDTRKEVTQGTRSIFAGKPDSLLESPSSVDDLAREVPPFAGLAGVDRVKNGLHRLPHAVGNDLTKPARRRAGHQLSVGVLKQIGGSVAVLAELDAEMVQQFGFEWLRQRHLQVLRLLHGLVVGA